MNIKMMLRLFVISNLILLAGISCSSKTIVSVSSDPPGAFVVFKESGESIQTDGNVTLLPGAFKNNRQVLHETLVYKKEGFREKKLPVKITKGKDETVPRLKLEELNTRLKIATTPVSARLNFGIRNFKKIDISSDTIEINRICKYANKRSQDPELYPTKQLDFREKKASDQKFLKLCSVFNESAESVEEFMVGLYLPPKWPIEFSTPAEFESTENEANDLNRYIVLKKLDVEGYSPIPKYRLLTEYGEGFPLKLRPSQTNSINIPLKPIRTTLQIITEPANAIVEDVSSGGFGYLGVTPLVRNFNWEDVRLWSERRTFSDDRTSSKNKTINGVETREGREEVSVSTYQKTYGNAKKTRRYNLLAALYLDLRITKAGYEDQYFRRLRLPIGEERSFHKTMKLRISNINFASEPSGVHVYVKRSLDKEIFNDSTGQFELKQVFYRKHLGSTPFTLNIDPNDPLGHGETLLFEKTGFKSATMEFAEGNNSYHQVMTPENIKER